MLPLIVIAVDADLTDVRDVEWDGQVAWVATAGGVEVYDADGERLARLLDLPSRDVRDIAVRDGQVVLGTARGAYAWDGEAFTPLGPDKVVVSVTERWVVYRDGTTFPEGDLGQSVAHAVELDGELYGFTAHGLMLHDDDEQLLPGPVADVAVVDGTIRVACHLGAALVRDGRVSPLGILATAAGEVWGTADGALVDDRGVPVTAVPAAVSSVVRTDDGWLVGTDDGLFVVDGGTRRVTEDGLCGNFVTSLTRWRGQLVAGTFDQGACVRQEDGTWTPLSLPSTLTNAVLGTDDALWIGTSEGLVRHDEGGAEVVGRVRDDASRHEPGLNHAGVNGLAMQGDDLWVADVLGPVRVGADGRWNRYRWHVTGHSYQDVTTCPTGEVWLGSEDDGLAVLGAPLGSRNGRSRWHHVNVTDGLPEDWVMDVACAGRGAAWVGTYRHGVGRVDARGWHPVQGLEQAWVQALAVDGERLWVGTADGLYLVDQGVPALVAPHSVHALLLDGQTLWIGTETGLDRLELPPTDGLADLP